jgi:hypothetical protein
LKTHIYEEYTKHFRLIRMAHTLLAKYGYLDVRCEFLHTYISFYIETINAGIYQEKLRLTRQLNLPPHCNGLLCLKIKPSSILMIDGIYEQVTLP